MVFVFKKCWYLNPLNSEKLAYENYNLTCFKYSPSTFLKQHTNITRTEQNAQKANKLF